MTALHVAAIRGSSASIACLLRHGALIDCLVQGSNATPWLSRGSSALHIAAAKGFTDVLATLLAALHHVPEGGSLSTGVAHDSLTAFEHWPAFPAQCLMLRYC